MNKIKKANELFKNVIHGVNNNAIDSDENNFTTLVELLNDIRNDYIRENDEMNSKRYLVYAAYFCLFIEYCNYFRLINEQKYRESWDVLQTSIVNLNFVKRHSHNINMPNDSFFEKQLFELEKLYPYNVFLSIGAIYKDVKCSICGLQVHDDDCLHITGEIYKGKIAQRIIKDGIIEEVSIVKNPYDKRCVAEIEGGYGNEYYKCVKTYCENVDDIYWLCNIEKNESKIGIIIEGKYIFDEKFYFV